MNSRLSTFLRYALMILGSVVLLAPLAWMVSVSLSTEEEARAMMGTGLADQLVPAEPQPANYPEALKKLGAATTQSVCAAAADTDAERGASLARLFGFAPSADDPWGGFKDALANSVLVTSLNVFGVLLSSSLVGYVFARVRFRGRRTFFLLTLATMMLPYQVTMIPLFLIFRSLGVIDTFIPLVVPAFFGLPFFIFMFRQFFSQIPESLLEAARLDGASNFYIWWRIMLPLCKPTAAITAIFTFIWTWNDFMNPLIYLQSPSNFTIALALNSFRNQFGGVNDVHLLMAASVVAMLPCAILFFAAQRHFVRGLLVGGVKG